MVRRSVLFSPGDRAEFLRKAPTTGADVVVFDLEDGVDSSRVELARSTVETTVCDSEFDPTCELWIRVSSITSERTQDLDSLSEAIRSNVFDGIVLPKVESTRDITSLTERMDVIGMTVPVVALIETPRGVLNAEDVASAPAVDAVMFGAEDFLARVGTTRSEHALEILYPRSRIVTAATASGVEAIDTVFTDLNDGAGLVEDAELAADLGFDGKMAIHPGQIEPIHEAFTPDSETLDWAESVIAASVSEDAGGDGAFRHDDQMIDRPLIEQARRILQRGNREVPTGERSDH